MLELNILLFHTIQADTSYQISITIKVSDKVFIFVLINSTMF